MRCPDCNFEVTTACCGVRVEDCMNYKLMHARIKNAPEPAMTTPHKESTSSLENAEAVAEVGVGEEVYELGREAKENINEVLRYYESA